jgi:hypothetical protein
MIMSIRNDSSACRRPPRARAGGDSRSQSQSHLALRACLNVRPTHFSAQLHLDREGQVRLAHVRPARDGVARKERLGALRHRLEHRVRRGAPRHGRGSGACARRHCAKVNLVGDGTAGTKGKERGQEKKKEKKQRVSHDHKFFPLPLISRVAAAAPAAVPKRKKKQTDRSSSTNPASLTTSP